MRKIELIQMYRGMAATLVVLLHVSMGIYSYSSNHFEVMSYAFRAGWSGVDFFFCLSGFIIYFVHYRDFGCQKSVKKFILARIVRVYPLVWIATSIFLGAYFLFRGMYHGEPKTLTNIISSYTLFPLPDNAPIIVTSWSLSYEMFFYLIFGLCLYFKPSIFRCVCLFWFVVIIIGVLVPTNIFAINFINNVRNIEFLFGVIAAIIIVESNISRPLILLSLGVTGFILSYYMATIHLIQEDGGTSVICFGVSFALVIIGSVALEQQKILNVPRVFILVGEASYAIYLFHIMFLSLIIKRLLINLAPSNMLGIVLTLFLIIVGIFVHVFIELPMTKFIKIRAFNVVK